jgi:hypothetical protein
MVPAERHTGASVMQPHAQWRTPVAVSSKRRWLGIALLFAFLISAVIQIFNQTMPFTLAMEGIGATMFVLATRERNLAASELSKTVRTMPKWPVEIRIRRGDTQTGSDAGILYREGSLLMFHGRACDFALPNDLPTVELIGDLREHLRVSIPIEQGPPMQVDVSLSNLKNADQFWNDGISFEKFIYGWKAAEPDEVRAVLPPIKMRPPDPNAPPRWLGFATLPFVIFALVIAVLGGQIN